MWNKYQKHKETIQKEASEKYQNFSEEERHQKWEKAQERDQNFTEEERKESNSIIMKAIKIFLRNKSRS